MLLISLKYWCIKIKNNNHWSAKNSSNIEPNHYASSQMAFLHPSNLWSAGLKKLNVIWKIICIKNLHHFKNLLLIFHLSSEILTFKKIISYKLVFFSWKNNYCKGFLKCISFIFESYMQTHPAKDDDSPLR